MYLTRVELKNIRGLEHFVWELGENSGPGWHVLLGDNGSGKSSVLRAIALLLTGQEALRFPLNASTWVRQGVEQGEAKLEITPHTGDAPVLSEMKSHTLGAVFTSGAGLLSALSRDPAPHPNSRTALWRTHFGWFSAGYGPFRRFTGGNPEQETSVEENSPHAVMHFSLFSDSFSLASALAWLKDLKFIELYRGVPGENGIQKHKERGPFDDVKAFINQPDFLPFEVTLDDVTPEGIFFVDGNGVRLPIESLGDGYRSMLALVLDLLRRLGAAQPSAESMFRRKGDQMEVTSSGVVLIDEADVHLHPEWQQRLGTWFTTHFPNLQFIVTTHSPLICWGVLQPDGSQKGSVWSLPTPGNGDQGGPVSPIALKRLLYGNVLEGFGTGYFGEHVSQSPIAVKLLLRLAQLNQQGYSRALTPDEEQERKHLRENLLRDGPASNPEAPTP